MSVPNVQELTDEQLEELIAQQQESAPEAANALQQLLDHRRSVQSEVEKLREKAAAQTSSRSSGSRRTGTTQPRERHQKAAQNFMQDQAKIDRWNQVIERAKSDDGTVQMTGEIIQIAIAAYYAQRKRDVQESAPGNSSPVEEAVVEQDVEQELAGVASQSSSFDESEFDSE